MKKIINIKVLGVLAILITLFITLIVLTGANTGTDNILEQATMVEKDTFRIRVEELENKIKELETKVEELSLMIDTQNKVIGELNVSETEKIEPPAEKPEVSENPPTEPNIIHTTHKVINVGRLNVRKGPSTQYSVITAIPVNSEVVVIEEINGWGLIKWNDVEGYSFLGYLEKIQTEEHAAQNNTKVEPYTTIKDTSIEKITSADKIVINRKITEPTGLTADQIDKVITYILTVKYNKKNSKFLNKGQAFYNIEVDNNVNAFFALSVATFETGWGTAGVAKQNNLFGFTRKDGISGYMSYDKVDDSIAHFGRHLRSFYFDDRKLTEVAKISSVYCPPNSSKWTYQVETLIDFYADIAEQILQK